jgi:hypothetical protein
MLQQLLVKVLFKFKNGTLVGYCVCMGNSTFVFGFCNEYTPGIGVERMTENIEKKIALAHKADGKIFAVFGLRGAAIGTPAFEIQYAVKI